jgi:hypothetical protein
LIFEIERSGMRKSLLAYLGLNKSEWGKDDVLSWIRWKKLNPCWSDEYGLYFKPRDLGRGIRKRFQEILQINSREDVEQLRKDLKHPPRLKRVYRRAKVDQQVLIDTRNRNPGNVKLTVDGFTSS